MPLELDSSAPDFAAAFARFLAAKRELAADVDAAVAAILDEVRTRGDEALIALTKRFDRLELDAGGLAIPAGEITAWSTFTPGFLVNSFAVVGSYVIVQSDVGDLYVYGGPSRSEYDSSKVTVRTPHHDADKPTENKRIQSFDVMCNGAWSVSVGMLPNNTDAFELAANISNNTFGLMSIPFAGYGTHFAFHLEHAAPGPALLASIHVNLQEGVVK